ncbi:GntR family transcriptional regulator [bacterium]|nr:GntR family transcriptional regulator [bacterium]
MKIIISNSSPDPIYEQVGKQIKAQVLSGELKEGDALPSIRALAKELQISVITTKRAYDELIKEGFVDSVGGKGCFIAMQNKELLKEKRMKTIEEKLGVAVNDAQKLGIPLGDLKEMLDLLYREESE